MHIIGISAFYHDSAACLLSSGTIVGAAQEERFTRIKHDASFPINAIKFCLNYAGLQPDEIDFVVFYEKPFLKFERLLETYLEFAPRGFGSFASSMPLWIKDKLFQKRNIIKQLEESICAQVNWSKKLLFSDHHLSHVQAFSVTIRACCNNNHGWSG